MQKSHFWTKYQVRPVLHSALDISLVRQNVALCVNELSLDQTTKFLARPN